MFARRHPHMLLALGASAIAIVSALSFMAAEVDGGISSFDSDERAIALTFDDGPDPRFTPRILDTLAENHAHATFFVVGEQARAHPELVARMVREGHEVAHHTHTHPQIDEMSQTQLIAEMDAPLRVLASQGVTPSWYRPPRGRLTPSQGQLVADRRMKIAMWARCFERDTYPSAALMARSVAAATQPAEIVLAHDGRLDRTMTVEALPLYLRELQARDLDVLTLSELERRCAQ